MKKWLISAFICLLMACGILPVISLADESGITLSKGGSMLSANESINLGSAQVGYSDAPNSGDITITNNSSSEISSVSFTKEGNNADDFGITPIYGISTGSSDTFVISLNRPRLPGTYTATVKVNCDRVTVATLSVSATVTSPLTFSGINAENNFGTVNEGYTADDLTSITATVTNSGDPITGIQIKILNDDGSVDDYFTVSPTTLTELMAEAKAKAFTITPKTGLSAGGYSSRIVIESGTIDTFAYADFHVSFTVNAVGGDPTTPTTPTVPAASSGKVYDGIGAVGSVGQCYYPDEDAMLYNVCPTYGAAAYFPIYDVNGDLISDHRMVENLRIKVSYSEGGELIEGEPQLVKLRVGGEYYYYIRFSIKQSLSAELRDVYGSITLNKSKRGNASGKDYRVKDLMADFNFEVGCEYNYSDDLDMVVDSDLEIPLWPNEFFILKYDCDDEVEFEFGSESNEGSFTVDVSGQGKNLITFNTEPDDNIAAANPDAKIIALNFNGVRFNRSGEFCYEADGMKYAYAIQNGSLVKIAEFENDEVSFKTNTLGRYIFSDRELVSPENIGEAVFIRDVSIRAVG